MARRSSVQFQIGPLSVGLPGLIIGGVVVVGLIVGGAVVLKAKIKGQNTEQPVVNELHQLKSYTINEIVGGNYYVKDGDAYYLPAQGCLYSSTKNDTIIAKAADPEHRMAMFGADDIEIPTMYSDSLLIYKAVDGGSIPEETVLERYKDEGYSIGVRGLSMQNGKCHTEVSEVSFYPGSSALAITAQNGTDLIIDKIDGVSVTEQQLSSAGTISGLTQNTTYTVDAYSGTNYIGGEITADTHMFSSMERFTIEEYSMDPSNFAILAFPKDLWSGYYYVNGMGMIRYINHPKSMGDEVDTFNEEYYVTDQHGNVTTNPANTVLSDEQEKEDVWNYRFPVDEGKPYLSVKVTCTGKTSDVKGTLFAPDGRRTTLSSDTDSQLLTGSVENPSAGAWTLSMTGLKDKVFDINIAYTEVSDNAPVSTVIKDSSNPVQATVVLGKPLNDASVTFRWENSEYAGVFKLEGPDGTVYGNEVDPSSVTKEIYGEVKIHTGYLADGKYKFTADGKALGHIYITYEDAAPSEGESGGEISAEMYEINASDISDDVTTLESSAPGQDPGDATETTAEETH